ncbi:MAG TPA: UvrD-helicase domain-containing protein [Symbiobacteriaceae bacterium]|nr:UvrD-helicase domain-containing protein [Symbiobacteriaceae bacterium]
MSRLDHLVKGLNGPQAEAALHRDGPLLVIAGAGAGKTKTAIHRLACLLASGASPDSVICITFTNKAAREMRERAASLVGPAAENVMIRTFHSAAVVLLREYLHLYPQSGRNKKFSIADSNVQLALIKEAIAERNFDLKANKPESFLWRIGRFKNEMADPDTLLYRHPSNDLMDWERVQVMIQENDRYVNRLTAEIWKRYEEKLRATNMLDFDDLINLFVRMMVDVPEVRTLLQRRFRYLQVDEFQDTNIAQLQMVKLLAGEAQNVMAVGDDAQSIYSWRSADIRCILEFERVFNGARVVKLEQNYRSTGAIIRAANRLITHNKSQRAKTLFTAQDEGWPIITYEADNDLDEARYVVMEIKKGVALGRKYQDYAILFRTNVQTRVFEDRLREEGVPYTVVGGPSFYDRREVQDVMGYIRLLDNPRDSVSFERVLGAPRKGIGEKGFQKVLALASPRELDLVDALEAAVDEGVLQDQARAGALQVSQLFRRAQSDLEHGRPFPKVVDELVRDSGLITYLESEDKQKEERRADSVKSVLTSLYESQRRWPALTLKGYLERLSLQDAQDDDKGEEKVKLQTIHSSKGLEYPVVFVVGMEQGILPNRRALDEGNLEEERRLCYVAITRAREQLYLTNCRIRAERGGFTVTESSQFLPEALYGGGAAASGE